MDPWFQLNQSSTAEILPCADPRCHRAQAKEITSLGGLVGKQSPKQCPKHFVYVNVKENNADKEALPAPCYLVCCLFCKPGLEKNDFWKLDEHHGGRKGLLRIRQTHR